MIYFPNSKINLGLNIIEKRPDGYHNIESVFYPIPLEDVLEIRENAEEENHLEITGHKVDGDLSDNLCLTAYNVMAKRFESLPKVNIHLHKTIPLGAGLGGGSSDASYTLLLLNYIFNLGLNKEELLEIAREISADSAFFIENKPVYAHNRGDEFKEIDFSLQGKYLLLIKPDIFVSTKEAYSQIEPKKSNKDIRDILSQDIGSWKYELKNDFETSLSKRYKDFVEIKDVLYNLGAEYASLSGSGSTMYGIFNQAPKQDDIQDIGHPFIKLIQL